MKNSATSPSYTRSLSSSSLRQVLGSVLLLMPALAHATAFVDAGSSRSAWMPAPVVALQGQVFDVAGTPSISWEKVQGPGGVVFADADALDTTAALSEPGVYVLQLTVKTASATVQDRMSITVYDAGRTFGYSAEELTTLFSGDLGLKYNLTGLDHSRFTPPPAPYVHPRILFNPADLPGLRQRLATTELGQVLMARFRSMLESELYSGRYMDAYRDLVQGDPAAWAGNDGMLADMVYASFVALIDDDPEAGGAAASALATVCEKIHTDIQAVMPTTDYRNHIQGLIHREYIGLAYDFVYPFMSESERATVRKTLALATANMWSIGMDALPAPFANTSNWVPTHMMHLLMNALAIEGETGYDPDLYPRLVAGYERFLRFGVNSDGTAFEGMGKNCIIAQMLIPMAKRGDLLVASLPAKNHVQNYYTYAMVPWGDKFIWDEDWGGIGESRYNDVPALKYAFPNDPVIDTVYRNDLQQDYARLKDFNRRFAYKAMDFLMRAIFVEDYNHALTREESFQTLEQLPPTFFSNEQGLMIARSDWSEEAIQFHFRPRSVIGGHSHHDRNGFSLNALGRVWCPDRGVHYSDAKFHSLVFIDGKPSGITPAKVVEFMSDSKASFMVGDAQLSWGKTITRSAGGGEPASCTYNSFRLEPCSEPWADIPFSDLPHWETSKKVSSTWSDHIPVQRAFRTAGLVHGTQPYCLVIDDIQKDKKSHLYEWRLQIEKDLEVSIKGKDIILTDPKHSRRLLVRLLGAAGRPKIQLKQIADGKSFVPALSIETEAIAPDFKVMLCPFDATNTPPVTSFNGKLLNVRFKDGSTDQLTFSPLDEGRTQIEMKN